MPTLPSNNCKYLLMRGDLNFAADVFKMILMKGGFAFNRATHDEYADVLTDELPTGAGYTIGGVTLAGGALIRDDATSLVTMTWNNPSWLAVGGDIVTQGAIIFDDTVAADPIVGYIDFGAALITYAAGTFTVANVTLEV